MNRRLVFGLALAAGLAGAACTEQPQEQSLHEQSSVGSFVTACNTNGFNSLIAGYFSGSQQQLVKDYKDAMLAALAANEPGVAETNGFNILREIALAAKGTPQPPASTGSALAVETLRCIVEVTSTDVIEAVPGLDFFVEELNHAAGGGFEVRGGDGDPLGAVQAASGTPPTVIAGIAPPAPQPDPLTAAWWNNSLDGHRVLFYGDPGETSGYHWAIVPRAATFDPALVVTTCVDDAIFAEDANSVMLTESNVGVLAFVDATYIGCGGTPVAASAGRFDLLRHLASLGRKLIMPEAAVAAAVMPGLVGGAAKGVKSHFDVELVTDLNVDFTTVPSPIATLVVNQGTFDLTVTVTEDGDLVNGVLVTLLLEANNGTTNAVRFKRNGVCGGEVPSGVTGAGSFATGTVFFDDLCITKTGSVKVVMSAQAVNRSGQGLAKTPKIKVIPPPR